MALIHEALHNWGQRQCLSALPESASRCIAGQSLKSLRGDEQSSIVAIKMNQIIRETMKRPIQSNTLWSYYSYPDDTYLHNFFLKNWD